jgi:hypothetical protein
MHYIILLGYNLMLLLFHFFLGKIAAYMWADLHYQDARGRLSGMLPFSLLDKADCYVLY